MTVVFTIGHSNVDSLHIVGLLLQNKIDVVVDVRSTPYSRYAPQFNREQFAEQLKGIGIEYVFAGDYLGMRIKDPKYCIGGFVPERKIDYLKDIDFKKVNERSEYIKGIDRLIEIADEKQVAIMCSEEDPGKCHRHQLITQTLLARGIEVVHIRGNGNLEEAKIDAPPQSTLF